MAGELILIVEDNEKNLKLVRDILQYQRLPDAGGALGAGMASSWLAKTSPTWCCSTSNFRTSMASARCWRCARAKRHCAAPVVAVTAFAMSGDRRPLLDAGFDGYIAKPIDVRTFPQQVRELLRRSSTRYTPWKLRTAADSGRRRHPPEREAARSAAHAAGVRRDDGNVRARGAREARLSGADLTPSGHRDAGHGRLRGLPPHPGEPRDLDAARRHGHGEQ